MKRTRLWCWAFGLLTIPLLATLGTTQESSTPQIEEQRDSIEVLTRGPLHEAYAQPLEQQPEPGALVPKQPPEAIPEEPPAERPDLENSQWLPGYWAWDAESQDFMWVSGIYRVPPQGRTFVPGYWSYTPEGWRWIPGFWADANQPEVPYTPEPPAPLDTEPTLPPPDDNSIYIPGVWVYRDTRFVWRPGYYSLVRVGRIWVPSHYVWTPNGYLFVEGYWDWPYESRGLVYAPVCFRRPLWHDAGWRYRPSFVVSFGAFFDSAFVRAGGCHYYFGNYYGANYARLGYNPWYTGRGRHDPVFAYHGWQNHRNNPNWVRGVQTQYAQRNAGQVAVPPATFAQQTAQVRTKKGTPIVTPTTQFTSTQVKLVQATPNQFNAQKAFGERVREASVNRQQFDAGAKKNQAAALRLAPTNSGAPQTPANPGPRGTETRVNPTIPSNPAVKSGNKDQPRIGTPPKDLPRIELPKNTSAPPRIDTPAPKDNPRPQPKFTAPKNDPPQQPKNTNPFPKFVPKDNPPPQPNNTNPLPKFVPPAPKDNPLPKFVPTPKDNPPPQPKNTNPLPKFVPPAPKDNPPPQPKIVTPTPQVPTPVQPRIVPQQPKIVTPTPPQPKIVTPQPQPRVTPQPPPAPRVQTPAPPPPRVTPPPQPAPRVQTPAPPPPRVQSPPPRSNPTPAPPRSNPTPAPQPPRVQSPPPRSNPAPAPKSNPPSGGKKR